MENTTIKIDIVSDVACPWCYVGKRRFEAALKEWKGAPIEVNWHPFQLDPSMPSEGLNRTTYLTNKFGSVDGIQTMIDRLTEAGNTVGINFDFGNDWLAVNTLHLHQLLHIAREEGFNVALKEKFLSAYLVETKHLNKIEVLVDIVKEFGWNREKVESIINDKKIAETVQAEIAHYQSLGVSGVPFFIINDKYGISGAQTTDVFLDAFKSVSPIEVISEGDTCDPATGIC